MESRNFIVGLAGFNENGNIISIKTSLNSLRSIEHEHAEVHEGHMWSYVSSVTASTSGYKWLITVPASSEGYVHINFVANCITSAKFELFETSPSSTTGSALTILNNYRPSTETSKVTLRGGVTTSTSGLSRIYFMTVGANNNKTRVGGEIKQGSEYVLKPATNYLWKATPLSSAALVTFGFEYYIDEL